MYKPYALRRQGAEYVLRRSRNPQVHNNAYSMHGAAKSPKAKPMAEFSAMGLLVT